MTRASLVFVGELLLQREEKQTVVDQWWQLEHLVSNRLSSRAPTSQRLSDRSDLRDDWREAVLCVRNDWSARRNSNFFTGAAFRYKTATDPSTALDSQISTWKLVLFRRGHSLFCDYSTREVLCPAIAENLRFSSTTRETHSVSTPRRAAPVPLGQPITHDRRGTMPFTDGDFVNGHNYYQPLKRSTENEFLHTHVKNLHHST